MLPEGLSSGQHVLQSRRHSEFSRIRANDERFEKALRIPWPRHLFELLGNADFSVGHLPQLLNRIRPKKPLSVEVDQMRGRIG